MGDLAPGGERPQEAAAVEILQTGGPLVLSAIEVSVLMELVEANPQAGLTVDLGLIRAGPQRLQHFRFGQLKGEGVTLGVGKHVDDRSVGGRERLGRVPEHVDLG